MTIDDMIVERERLHGHPERVDLIGLLPQEARPLYREDFPLLWRRNGNLVLWSGRMAAEIDRIDARHVHWLRSLDGLRTWATIIQNVPIPLADASRLIRALIPIGALDDATSMPHSWRWIGEGERIHARGDLAAAAHVYGGADRANHAIDNRYATGVVVIGRTVLAALCRDAITSSGLRLVESGSCAGANGLRSVIVVLADGGHPDSITDVDTPLHDLPHMPVAVFGDRASVGPLVVPGQTSCLRCSHLHARDADGTWPLLNLQLASQVSRLRVAPTDRLLARAAALLAALILRGWADDEGNAERARAWGNSSFDLHLPVALPQRVSRPVHPLCGCHWVQTDRLCEVGHLG